MRNRSFQWGLCAGAALLAVCGGALLAQSTAGAVVGKVSDASGALVPGAGVTLTRQETGFERQTVSDESGAYEFRIVDPGTYTLTAELPGFKKYVNRDLVLASRQTLRVDSVLEIGEVSETVTVAGEAPLVTTDTGTIAESRSARLLTEGPAGTPVMAQFGNKEAKYSLLVRNGGITDVDYKAAGSRGGQWETSIDGNQMESGFLQNTIPYSALQETKVTVVGAPAEYRTPLTIDAVTKQGTNALHGSVLFNLAHARLNALSAQSPTSKRGPQTPSHQWNYTVGGPVYVPKIYDGRNRSFFFFSFERVTPTESNNPTGTFLSVPTAAMRQGDFSKFFAATGRASKALIDPFTGQPFAGQIIPSARLNPAAVKAVAGFIHAPNLTTSNPEVPLLNFAGPSSNSTAWHAVIVRGDQKILQNNTAGFVYNQSPFTSSFSNAARGMGPNVLLGRARFFEWHDTHIFSPRVVNELRISYFMHDNGRHGNDGSTLGAVTDALGIDLGADAAQRKPIRQAPQISITGFGFTEGRTIGTTYNDDDRIQRWLQIRDNFSFQFGRHSLKAGYDHRFKRDDRLSVSAATGSQQSYTGRFSGDPFADFLLGLPSSTSRFSTAIRRVDRRLNDVGLYLQDDFKATPRLTLNFGLRFERISPRTESHGAQINFDPKTGAIVYLDEEAISKAHPALPKTISKVTAAQAGFPSKLVDGTLSFAPRVSFAYRLSDKGNSVVRGSYSIFSVDAGVNVNNFRLVNSGTFALTESFVNTVTGGTPLVTLDRPFPNQVGAGPSSISTGGANPDLGVPILQQYTLMVERQFYGNWVGRIGYVGSRGTQIWYARNINRPPASTTPYSASRAIYPQYQNITYIDKGANSAYHGLQAGLAHRYGNGLELDGLFQWVSEFNDVGENGFSTFGFALENPYCRSCDRARNPVVDTLDFRMNFVYDLPVGRSRQFGSDLNRWANGVLGGWALSGIFDARNGRFDTVIFSGKDTSNTNLRGGRADVLPNCDVRSGDGKSAPYLNINCFAIPKDGTFGNASPALFQKPGSWDVSGAVYKYFPFFREDVKLRVNAVFNNLFNHPTWNGVGNNISSPASFGRLFGQGAAGRSQSSRSIQFQFVLQW